MFVFLYSNVSVKQVLPSYIEKSFSDVYLGNAQRWSIAGEGHGGGGRRAREYGTNRINIYRNGSKAAKEVGKTVRIIRRECGRYEAAWVGRG